MNELKEKEYQRRNINETSDEIDLRYVFSKIGNGFGNIKRSGNSLINLIVRNFLVILAFILIAVGIGYVYYNSQRPFYRSTMTLMLHNLRNEFVEDQMQRLTDLIEDGNYAALATRLEISKETASEIRNFRFSNIDEDRIPEDSVLTGGPFKIELTLYNNKLFSTMEPALVNYLENNPFFSKQKQLREVRTRKVISKLRNDISSIDSVKESLVSPKGPINGFVYGEALDPTELYRESINMYREQVNLESSLDRLETIEVINGFVPRIRPSGPQLSVYILVSGLIGFIAGMIAASKLEKRRRGV